MSTVIRIVAAVVDTRNLTMYKEDGSTIIIPQGDPRLRKIVSEATPQLILKGWADIIFDPPEENSYAEFEEKSSGAVKFFRIAKAKLKGLFSNKPEPEVPPQIVGNVPSGPVIGVVPNTKVLSDVLDTLNPDRYIEEVFEPVTRSQPAKVEQTMNAIDEIMKHAIPVSHEDFNEDSLAIQGNVVEANGDTIKANDDNEHAEDTIIAVVDNKVIPGMERIKTQFSRAAKLGSTQGVENFLRRLASVIEQRKHSVDDLLKFMERGDMPIADDGSILIYKVLNRSGGRSKYKDCHTGNVEQWTGAYVCMDPSLVDHNRNTECSNGLHVARRGYIRNFSGNVCVLAKLAPEDVIAVPTYDANKMRVCGYHILVELSESQYSLLKQNRPLTDDKEGKRLLAQTLAGKHIHRTHEVRITEQKGGGVITKVLSKAATMIPFKTPDAPVEAVALENHDVEVLDVPTNPLDVVKTVEKEQLTRKEQAKVLYDTCAGGSQEALDALKAFKKSSKTSWEKLGLPDLNGSTFSVQAHKLDKPKGKAHKAPQKVKAKKVKPVVGKSAPEIVQAAPVMEGSPRERIHKILQIRKLDQTTAYRILDIKKASKKSWEYLSVSESTVALIVKLSNK